jgi:type IV pilus assembly protein PilA
MAVRINRLTTVVCLTAVAGAAFAGNSSPSDAVTAGLAAAMPAKLAVSEKFAKTGQWPESNAAAGFEASASEGAASVNVGSGGLITVTFNDSAGLAGKSIVLTPSSAGHGTVHWSCKGADFPANTLPKECQ